MPEKLFILEKKENVTEEIHLMQIVYALPPKNIYVPEGKMIIKFVACMEGQTISFDGKNYFCDQNYLATVQEKDSKGRYITPSSFTGVIPKDKFWLLANHDKSFDSRYFGLVDRKDIKGIAKWKF